MRVITGTGIVRESSPEAYTATPTSNILGTAAFAAGFRMLYVLTACRSDELANTSAPQTAATSPPTYKASPTTSKQRSTATPPTATAPRGSSNPASTPTAASSNGSPPTPPSHATSTPSKPRSATNSTGATATPSGRALPRAALTPSTPMRPCWSMSAAAWVTTSAC